MSLERMLAPLRRRIGLLVARAVIQSVDDAKLAQVVQVGLLAGEDRRLERFQEYGFTSHPKKPSGEQGAEAVVVCPTADRAQGIIIAVEDRRYRLKSLAEGEVAIYDDQGNKIHIQRGKVLVEGVNEVEVSAPVVDVDAATSCTIDAGTSVTITAPTINLVGNVNGGPAGGPALTVNGAEASLDSGAGAKVAAAGAFVDVT